MKKEKKKLRTMDVILLLVAVALVAFTLEMLEIYRETGAIPDTLCTCVFAALGGECGAMAWIKTTKERRTDRKWQREDQARAERLDKERENNKEAIS